MHAVAMDQDDEVVYGSEVTLELARDLIAARTDLAFVEHESSFWGGDYYLAAGNHGRIMIHSNADAHDGEPIEDGFSASWTIVRVSIPGLTLKEPFMRKSAQI